MVKTVGRTVGRAVGGHDPRGERGSSARRGAELDNQRTRGGKKLTMLKTAWERDDSEFMFVDATVRHWLPSSMSWEMVSKSLTASLVRPYCGKNEGSERERRPGGAGRSEAGSYRNIPTPADKCDSAVLESITDLDIGP